MAKPKPKLYVMMLYVDANGDLNFNSTVDGAVYRSKTPAMDLNQNDYLKWRIGGNQKDIHNAIVQAEVNSKQLSAFFSQQYYWIWPSGDNPPQTPECVIYNANAGDRRFGVAVSLTDGSCKTGEITITLPAPPAGTSTSKRKKK